MGRPTPLSLHIIMSSNSSSKPSGGAELSLKDEDGSGHVQMAPTATAEPLKRSLKSRHMQMMAIGAVIGPGYFVGSGSGLTNGGSGGILIAFGVVGMLLWATMQSLGEMAAFISVSGSFTEYMSRFVDPAVGFALGWNYAFMWFGFLAAEYNNLGLVMTYWKSALPNWGFILVFWCIFLAFAMLGVLAFGEAEFWLTVVKILFILAFFLCCILITTGAIGDQGPVGFKFYKDPGPFADGVAGVFKVFVFAAGQYSGSEMIGITAGESVNPARDVPKAVKLVFWRVLFFFMGGFFFINLCVPWNDPTLLSATSKTARSPFVIAFTRAGLPRGADAMNSIIIITIFSAINGALYVCSRCLVNLALDGKAPKWLGKVNARGVPWSALIFANLFGFISLLNLSSSAGQVYSWLINITGVATFITWAGIALAHIRFRKALELQGISLDELPYKAPFYPYGAYFALIGATFFIFFQGWTCFLSPFSVNDFFMSYIMIPVFILMAGGYKLYHKTKFADLATADLVNGRRHHDTTTTIEVEGEAPKRSFVSKIGAKIVG
ncbi:amino acid transporter [Leucosporidium creatinivorum]|uniref:Amino acid transporter n=1 Tax=Leucosporidium creatinivorum TaxID=106004 RepID=A0A1Y2FBK4_9BASI|nr:amino acid transporter [Leucosporidium creatinivorum]